MKTIPSTEAKTHFGALLDAAQRHPVMIEKKGRPVAVIMSEHEYEAYEALKLQALQRDLSAGIQQADQGELLDSDEAFAGLV
ncbi:type II toxin-antitoxin system Phd/YefM family antitoxin [Methylotuvimicrobium sp. KM2]|uniref:type II toxin-antitoxin system Phd/YefM family antitoxin n=1 Tax=Methylotuvimicrobium sp. KM2 TaxID=3133976 RepID=UPI003100FEA1